MQVYCESCREPQVSAEQKCLKCGTPFGGSIWHLLLGILLFLSPALLLIDNKLCITFALKVFFWYQLPILIATAFIFDYHPRRRGYYFWGGSAVIVASIYFFK